MKVIKVSADEIKKRQKKEIHSDILKSLQAINDKADYIEQIADKLEECEKDLFVESAIILRANVNEILSYLGELEFCKE